LSNIMFTQNGRLLRMLTSFAV